MSEIKHTPGPWEAVRAEHDAHPGFEWWLHSPSYGCVGYWTGHKQDHKDGRWLLSECDARLIAAAPDTLQSLRSMTDWVKAALNCKDWHWDGDQREAAEIELATALAAIAKAEGLS